MPGAAQDGNFHCLLVMSDGQAKLFQNTHCGIHVTIMHIGTIRTSSNSKLGAAFRPRSGPRGGCANQLARAAGRHFAGGHAMRGTVAFPVLGKAGAVYRAALLIRRPALRFHLALGEDHVDRFTRGTTARRLNEKPPVRRARLFSLPCPRAKLSRSKSDEFH